jgi:preprotein translocase subunit YajC
MKRQKEVKTMLDSLAKGDEVVTQGGVIGKITKLGETFASVEVANGVELQVQRSAIVQVLPKGSYK